MAAAFYYGSGVAKLDFEKLVEDYYMPLYRFALSLSRQESDAADLTQQTFFLWASKVISCVMLPRSRPGFSLRFIGSSWDANGIRSASSNRKLLLK